MVQSTLISFDIENLDFTFYCDIEVFTGKNLMVRTSQFFSQMKIGISQYVCIFFGNFRSSKFLTWEGYASPPPRNFNIFAPKITF